MLLHRYHNIDYVFTLDLEIGLRLIQKAQEKEREERIFQQWVAQLPVMALSDSAVSFDEYRENVTGGNIDFRPEEIILAELSDVEKKFERGNVDGA